MMEHTLLRAVAEQLLTEGKGEIVIAGVNFQTNGRELHAIEQNPDKPSRWGKLAKEGHRVVQFGDPKTHRYVAVSVDGEIKEYVRMKT